MFRVPQAVPFLSRLLATPALKPRMLDDSCRIDGRTYSYGVIEGDGPTVVLIHGWGLGHRSYRRAAESLAELGHRVIVPDLPGFGGSSDLPLFRINLASYASAMRTFLQHCSDVAGSPAHLVGHSFGGAVAAQIAHDDPELVGSVVLVSSATGATWTRSHGIERALTERPLWNWGVHLVREMPIDRVPRATVEVLRDLSHNLLWHWPSLGLVANMIRKSDLREELALVGESGVPVAVVWGSEDRVITKASFDDQCSALGCDGHVVEGNHGWPLANPTAFARTISEILRTIAPH